LILTSPLFLSLADRTFLRPEQLTSAERSVGARGAVARVTASGQGQAKFCMLFRFRISGWPTALVNNPVSLDSCCFSKAGARTNVEGSSQSGAYHSRHNLVFGGSSGTVTMMQACASAAKLRATDPFCARHDSHGLDRVTATSTRHRPLARVRQPMAKSVCAAASFSCSWPVADRHPAGSHRPSQTARAR